jgi:CBS domain-containing membrane protein
MLASWLSGFVPSSLNTRPREWLRAAVGASLGVLATVLLCGKLFGGEVALHLAGPLGASAVLLFAVSSGALAQPWSIVGSYLLAAIVAVLVVHVLGKSLDSACVAVGIALALMCPLRCLHPPGGAVAFVVAMADPAMDSSGLSLVLPVLFNALCLLGCALIYNNLSRVPYPRPHVPPAQAHHTRDPAPEQRVGIATQDLDQALADMGHFVDITREDLELIVRATEKYALRRSMGDIRAAQIMSRDLLCVAPETTVAQALRLFEHHHVKALPVMDEVRRLVGIVSLIDLIGHARRAKRRQLLRRLGRREVILEEVMSSPVTCVDSHAHLVELIPLLSSQGLHCLPVLEQGELVGLITQSDLIAALNSELIMHLQ